jgi:hypothetical protein
LAAGAVDGAGAGAAAGVADDSPDDPPEDSAAGVEEVDAGFVSPDVDEEEAGFERESVL